MNGRLLPGVRFRDQPEIRRIVRFWGALYFALVISAYFALRARFGAHDAATPAIGFAIAWGLFVACGAGTVIARRLWREEEAANPSMAAPDNDS